MWASTFHEVICASHFHNHVVVVEGVDEDWGVEEELDDDLLLHVDDGVVDVVVMVRKKNHPPNVEVGHEAVVHVLGGVVHPHSSCVGDHDDVLDADGLVVHSSHGLS